jgi:hypothetical protein
VPLPTANGQPQPPPPTLRVREGQLTRACPPGIVVIGKAVGTDGETVVIEGARSRRSEVFLQELGAVVGNADLAVGLILDAVEHGDQIKIGVDKKRVTYSNPAQLARFREMAEAAEKAGA